MLSDFKFHHIGIATDNIKNTVQFYLDADYSVSDTIYDPIQCVFIAFLEKTGMPRLELVEPNQVYHSPVSKIIKKSGVSPYHICYEVDNMESALNKLKKKRYLPLSRPVKAIAMDNRSICFLYNKEIGLIELLGEII